jgi:hypothetical protein
LAGYLSIEEVRFATEGRRAVGTIDDKTIGTKGSRDVLYHFFTPTGQRLDGRGGTDDAQWRTAKVGDQFVVEYLAGDPGDHRLPNPDLWVGILAIYAGSGVLALIGLYPLYKARVRRREVT